MAEKIVRHFKRIYFPRAENVRISWPCEPVKMLSTQVNTVYDGDTLHAFARFQEKPDGIVILTAKLENGETVTQSVTTRQASCSQSKLDLPGTLARMAAACEIKPLVESEEIATLAVKYQLMSRYTNYLALDVKVDGEKAGDLPALRKTAQMLAAGWGGTGTFQTTMCEHFELDVSPGPMFLKKDLYSHDRKLDYSAVNSAGLKNRHAGNFIDAMNRLHSRAFSRALTVASIRDLEANGVSNDIIEDLTELNGSGIDEYVIVVVFLYLLAQQERFKKDMSRSLRRVIIKAYKQLPEFQDEIAQKIEGIILSIKTL